MITVIVRGIGRMDGKHRDIESKNCEAISLEKKIYFLKVKQKSKRKCMVVNLIHVFELLVNVTFCILY